MSGDLRATWGAGRLQRTFAMRLLRVASAGVLSLAAMLLWKGIEPSMSRAPHATDVRGLALLTREAGSGAVLPQRLTSHQAAQPARVGGRHQPLVRSRAADGDGDPASVSALASSSEVSFANVAESARAHLRRLALGHAPYGEPSPFDATAPPASLPRNG